MQFDMISIPVTLKKANVNNVNKNLQSVIRSVKRTASGYALGMLKEFHKTTATWNHPVDFHFKVNETPDGVEILIFTDNDVYRYLDEGTDIRYAVMTDPFTPKTVPGWIGSGPGEGGLAYFDMENPRPGIQARGWTDMIFADKGPKAIKGIEDRFDREINNAFSRMF